MYWWPRYKHWVSWCGFLHFCRSKYFLIRSLPGIKVLTGNSVWDKKKHGNWQALLGERGMTPLPYPLNIRLQEEVSISNTERIKYPPNIPINFFQIEQSRVFVLPSHCWRKGAVNPGYLLGRGGKGCGAAKELSYPLYNAHGIPVSRLLWTQNLFGVLAGQTGSHTTHTTSSLLEMLGFSCSISSTNWFPLALTFPKIYLTLLFISNIALHPLLFAIYFFLYFYTVSYFSGFLMREEWKYLLSWPEVMIFYKTFQP